MEFTEISTSSLALKAVLPFCINSLGDNQFSLLTKNSTQIIKIQYKSIIDTNPINLLMSNCKCTKSQPTKKLEINHRAVYNGASIEEKHKICLSPVLLTYMAPTSSILIQNSWSPLNVYNNNRLLASLNIYGQVEVSNSIKPISQENEEWKPLINISKILLKYLDLKCDEQIRKFKDLLECVEDIVITSIIWKDTIENDISYLACASKSGRLMIVAINKIIDPANIDCKTYEFSTNRQISCMKWFTSPLTKKSFLIAGSHEGKVILYTTEILSCGKIDSCELKTELWSEDDSLSVGCIHVCFCEENNYMLVLIVKGSHIVMALLNSDGDLLQMDAYYVGNLFIVSLNELFKCNYVIATMAGYIIHLKMNIDGDKFNYETKQVKCNIDFNKYTLYGVAASDNKCLWIFATYPDMQFDHLSLRNPLNLFICSFSSANPLNILSENPSYRLTNYKDAAELYRLEKFKSFDENEVILNGVSISQKYIYYLKMRNIVLGANAGYYRRRSEKQYLIKLRDIDNIVQIIDAINAYLLLKKINNLPDKSDAQLKSARNLRIFIKNYIKRETFYEYKKIQNSLKSEFEQLYQETAYLTDVLSEKCSYCDENILQNELNCPSNHPILRCTFTYLQLSFMSSNWCDECKRGALPNEELNQIISVESDNNICPLCDSPFVKYFGT